MLTRLMFGIFSTIVVAGFWVDQSGNPGCRMYICERLGGTWAECRQQDCSVDCTDDLKELPGEPLISYCPCGAWEEELLYLQCLAKLVYDDPPVFGGGMPDCESLCDGCELQEYGWDYTPACSECK